MLKKQVKLDLIGLKCPVPVLKLAKNINIKILKKQKKNNILIFLIEKIKK